MKNKKIIIVLIILLSIIMLLVSVGFIKLLKNDFKIPHFRWNVQVSDELILDQTYEEKFNTIEIDSTAGVVEIKKSSSDKVKAMIYGDKDSTIVETTDNYLKVKLQDKTCIGFCFNQKSAKIEIYLPTSYDGKINVKNNYGDISIAEFPNANIDVDEDCGDVEILEGNIVNVNNSYGDIIIGKANISKINEDCGDVEISHVNDITIENSYGDIKIESINNYLNLKNDCGDIEVANININKDSFIKNDYGDIELGNTNEIFIDAQTDLGDIKINNNYNKSDIILKIENDCGDIDIKN